MDLRWLLRAGCALGCLGLTTAQTVGSVPPDLSSGFDPDSITLQVNYNGQAFEGFGNGAKFTTEATAQEPVFALGDQSGINNALVLFIMMVDTTTDNRVVHFVQTDFKTDGDKTGIASSSQPLFAYQGPGTLGETGERTYSFLLYQQKSTLQASSLPSAGQTIDMATFESTNGLDPALAGVAMVVDVTGAATTASTSVAVGITSPTVAPVTTPTVTQGESSLAPTSSVSGVAVVTSTQTNAVTTASSTTLTATKSLNSLQTSTTTGKSSGQASTSGVLASASGSPSSNSSSSTTTSNASSTRAWKSISLVCALALFIVSYAR